MMNAITLRNTAEKVQAERLAEKSVKFYNEFVEPALIRSAENGYFQHTILAENLKGVNLQGVIAILTENGFESVAREGCLVVKW